MKTKEKVRGEKINKEMERVQGEKQRSENN
jgi:hypothetical protein